MTLEIKLRAGANLLGMAVCVYDIYRFDMWHLSILFYFNYFIMVRTIVLNRRKIKEQEINDILNSIGK